MSTKMIASGRTLLAAALLSLSGCAGLGTLSDVLGGMGGLGGLGGELRGEVRWVDERRQELQVEDERRRAVTLRYDSRTEVVFRGERYAVRALEQGDLVSIRLQRDSRGDMYASRIDVEQSVRDQGGYQTGQLQRFEGRVERIDSRRGWFELEARNGGVYTVTLPYNPDSATLERFRRLRAGDYVRIEGGLMSRERVELRRFL